MDRAELETAPGSEDFLKPGLLKTYFKSGSLAWVSAAQSWKVQSHWMGL